MFLILIRLGSRQSRKRYIDTPKIMWDKNWLQFKRYTDCDVKLLMEQLLLIIHSIPKWRLHCMLNSEVQHS